MNIQPHTIDTAPDASKPLLKGIQEKFDFIPNVFGVLAESPAALTAYLQTDAAMDEHSSFSPGEREIMHLTISRNNNCAYCMSAHSTVAKAQNVPQQTVDALRSADTPSDPKHAALAAYVQSTIDHRGFVPDKDQQAFLDAGFTPANALEVITTLALKTLSNYTNHLADTPLDPPFAENRWTTSS